MKYICQTCGSVYQTEGFNVSNGDLHEPFCPLATCKNNAPMIEVDDCLVGIILALIGKGLIITDFTSGLSIDDTVTRLGFYCEEKPPFFPVGFISGLTGKALEGDNIYYDMVKEYNSTGAQKQLEILDALKCLTQWAVALPDGLLYFG